MIPNCMEEILLRVFESPNCHLQKNHRSDTTRGNAFKLRVSSWHVELDSEGLSFNVCLLNFNHCLLDLSLSKVCPVLFQMIMSVFICFILGGWCCSLKREGLSVKPRCGFRVLPASA